MGSSESKPQPKPQGNASPRPQQPHPYTPPSQGAAGAAPQRTLGQSPTFAFRNKYGLIPDNFQSVKQVQEKLREVGLESSNLIVGVDFTKSNEWTGKQSFQGRSLHAVGPEPNPYERAISIIGETLAPFDEDDLIPCFGFGDVSTHDNAVFNFFEDGRPCNGFAEVLQRYRQILPHIKLSGPTSFAPIIEAAVRIVELSGGQYHVLVIIADGQVTRSVDLGQGEQSSQEKATVDAICAASNYPLSIVLVGVGDGPWDTMEEFDDNLPQRNFDNFQFVNLTRIMASRGSPEQLAAKFALMALMEVPLQYKACVEMDLVGRRMGRMPPSAPLPPPPQVRAADRQAGRGAPGMGPEGGFPQQPSMSAGPGFPQQPPSMPAGPGLGAVPRPGGGAAASAAEARECPVCLQEPKSMAFQCGHQVRCLLH